MHTVATRTTEINISTAREVGASSRDLIAASVAGYEAGVRIGSLPPLEDFLAEETLGLCEFSERVEMVLDSG